MVQSGSTRVRLIVHGRVQGVGFRYAAREAAVEAGVSGWVRNLPDGTVEIVAQGTPEAVERLAEWAARGPRHAVVERVSRARLEPEEGSIDFAIAR
ncbi:MAG TPA: acylphosphatase [Candidatus Polarisedimenticolaceae bacterium]|nr:acylphosphatase [Candidatus Polarisedimenticolaceae bacterium]